MGAEPGPFSQVLRLRRAVALGLMCGLLLSPRLWLSSRFYPLTPVWPFLKPIPPPYDRLALGAMLVLLAASIIAPRVKYTIFAFVLLAAALAMADQSRWQPWFYQYVCMWIALGFAAGESAWSQSGALHTCRLIIASTYIWSGVQKINGSFVAHTFQPIVEPMAKALPALQHVFPVLGAAVPAIEIAIGVGLLAKRVRNAAVILAIVTHAFVLLAIGPLGSNINSVVWPWNAAMVCFVVLLFWRSAAAFRDMMWTRNFPFQRVVLALFCFAPLLSFFNLWDVYLSAALYSSNKNVATLMISDALAERLPEAVQDHVWVGSGSGNVDELDVDEWSFDELNVPPYPEVRIYRSVAKWTCGFARDPSEVTLLIQHRRGLLPVRERNAWSCLDLRW